MPVSEPTTLLTNAVLASVAAALAARLLRAGRSPARAALRLWAAALLAGAVAAAAGGIVHGFAPVLPALAHAVLWKVVLVATGLACWLLVSGSALAALEGAARVSVLVAAAIQLAVYGALVARSNDITLTATYGAVTIVALLALGLVTARRDPERLAWLLLALALSAAGIAAQRARVAGPGPFNHNDVCHVLQTVALWPFYRVGLRLQPRSTSSPS